MKVKDFIKKYCAYCDDFDYSEGCHAYLGEECDEAFVQPLWHGKKMCDRVTDFCHERRRKETEDSMKTSRKTGSAPVIKKEIKKAVETYENKKLKSTYFKVPKDINEAKETCKKICDAYRINISFDDKYGNFGPDRNMCACHTSIECAKFNEWNYDLLVIAVLHELGHIKGETPRSDAKKLHLPEEFRDSYNKNTFTREYDAWKWAIDKYLDLFRQNIGIKQGRYIVNCLKTYLPNYNTYDYDVCDKKWFEEKNGRFWCPIKKKVIK